MPKLRFFFALGLTLVLPWSGCEYIHQKELLIRQAEADNLVHQARTLAKVIEPSFLQADDLPHTIDTSQCLYLYKIADKIQLDGYHDDWGIELDSSMKYSNQLHNQFPDKKLSAIAGYNFNYMYLFFQVEDSNIIFAKPNYDNLSDHIVLDISDHPLAGRHFLYANAPGLFHSITKELDDMDNALLHQTTEIQGFWQDTATGYNIELRLPKSVTESRLGFSAYNYDITDKNQTKLIYLYGNQLPGHPATASFIKPSPIIQNILENTQSTASRIYVVNPDGWILASKYFPPNTGFSEYASNLEQTLFDILSQLYIFISTMKDSPSSPNTSTPGRVTGAAIETASKNHTVSSWYKLQGSNQPVMSIAYPIAGPQKALAIIIIEKNSSTFLSLQNPDFIYNIAYSLLMIIVLTLLMIYYTWKLARQSLADRH